MIKRQQRRRVQPPLERVERPQLPPIERGSGEPAPDGHLRCRLRFRFCARAPWERGAGAPADADDAVVPDVPAAALDGRLCDADDDAASGCVGAGRNVRQRKITLGGEEN